MNHKTLWTFAITSIALFMTTLDNLVVTTALPVIRHDLHASLQGLEWTVNAYTLTFAVLLLTGAALGDRFGRRRLFVIGLAVFTGASAMAALASSANELIAARAIQGLGGAIVLPLTLTILSAAVPPNRRGHVVAVDLLAERPLRSDPDPARTDAAEGNPRLQQAARPARPRALGDRSAGDRLGARPRQPGRLGLARDHFDSHGRRDRARPLCRLGAARRGANAADALLPQPHF